MPYPSMSSNTPRMSTNRPGTTKIVGTSRSTSSANTGAADGYRRAIKKRRPQRPRTGGPSTYGG